MNLQQQERFYQWMTRVKANENERSRAASTPPEKENETVTEVMNGLIVTRPAKKIEHLSTQEPASEAQVWNLTKDGPVLESKAGSTQYQTVIKEKRYEIPGSSTGDQIHKCGIHNFETKNVKEFNEHLTLHNDTESKAASVPVNKLQEILRFQRSNGRY